MATKIFLPRLGESITEAVIGKWLKQPGDSVVRGEVLAELETAKAMMELESPAKGTLLAVFAKPGDTVHLEELIAVVGSAGEEWDLKEKDQAETKDTEPAGLVVDNKDNFNNEKKNVLRLIVSPNAKRRAKELGISREEIAQIKKEGRITALDVEALIRGKKELFQEIVPFQSIPLNQIQAITARRMQQSMQSIPQFSVSTEICVDGLIRFIEKKKTSEDPKLTITAVLIWKLTEALLKHPRLNSRFENDYVIQFSDINIAVAVAADEGLFVPVIHQVQKLSIEEIAKTLYEVVEKTKNKRLSVKDTIGATFTISNLGMKGVTSFIPLVDPDQSAILGIGALHDNFSWGSTSDIHHDQVITFTLAADHRVIGGAEAADFLATLKLFIETL